MLNQEETLLFYILLPNLSGYKNIKLKLEYCVLFTPSIPLAKIPNLFPLNPAVTAQSRSR